MQVSQFRRVSIGEVLENKAIGSKEIEVKLFELSPFADGEIKSVAVEYSANGEDVHGKAYKNTLLSDHGVTATWLPYDTNRLTAPDVRRGERVDIYQYGDTDKYYWRELGMDAHLRRLETIIIGISDNPNNDSTDEPNLDNCYFLEFSTHRKAITIQTAKSNSEEFKYTFQMNPGEHTAVFQDDAGQHFYIDSKDRLIRMHNQEGCFVELSRKDAEIVGIDNVGISAGKKVNVSAGDSINLNAPKVNISNDCNVGGTLKAGSIETGSLKASSGISCGGVVKASAFVIG